MSDPAVVRSFTLLRDFSRGYSDLYFALNDGFARALSSGESQGERAFVAFVDALGATRTFHYAMEAALVTAASLHASVLQGTAETRELRRYYPSAGGRFAPMNAEALRAAVFDFFAARPASFDTLAQTLYVQTNEVTRGLAWLLPALHLLGGADTPVQLVDLGCSAGLNLVADHLAWRWERERGGPITLGDGGNPIIQKLAGDALDALPASPALPNVVRRIGIDRAPRHVTDERDRLLLRACIFPDHLDRHARFARAADAFTAHASGIELIESSLEDGVRGLRSKLEPKGVVLLYDTVATSYLSPEAHRSLSSAIHALLLSLAPAKALWLEMEPLPERPDGPLFLDAHLPTPQGFETFRLAEVEPHPRTVKLTDAWRRLT